MLKHQKEDFDWCFSVCWFLCHLIFTCANSFAMEDLPLDVCEDFILVHSKPEHFHWGCNETIYTRNYIHYIFSKSVYVVLYQAMTLSLICSDFCHFVLWTQIWCHMQTKCYAVSWLFQQHTGHCNTQVKWGYLLKTSYWRAILVELNGRLRYLAYPKNELVPVKVVAKNIAAAL